MKRIEEPILLIVFGASGDLAKRKLIPALYHLAYQNLLPRDFIVLGYARSKLSDEAFRESAKEGVLEFSSVGFDERLWNTFARGLFYESGGYDDAESFERLAKRVAELDAEHNIGGNHLFYLATPPSVFKPITKLIHDSGLCSSECMGRIIIEKPFGHDLASAHELNEHLLQLFSEEQICIDHYLGKETVQNIMVFRFGNSIFEPIWNRNFIDQVQITVAETLGIGDNGGCDKSSAIRDMLQNHMMQLTALTAMEPPVAFDPEAVRNQKVNVLRSIRLSSRRAWLTGWYAQLWRGVSAGKEIPDYAEKERTGRLSDRDVRGLKLEIDNWRWQGVPFICALARPCTRPPRSTSFSVNPRCSSLRR